MNDSALRVALEALETTADQPSKGVVSYVHKVSIEEAFDLIRTYARSHQIPISQVAARVVDLTLTLHPPETPAD